MKADKTVDLECTNIHARKLYADIFYQWVVRYLISEIYVKHYVQNTTSNRLTFILKILLNFYI